MNKHFNVWIGVKEKLHERIYSPPYFKEGEVWWVSVGENVGTEINGKGGLFSRPVVVFKKLSRQNFIGIPMTTKNKFGSWYSQIPFENRIITVNLSQLRVFDYHRLSSKLGEVDEGDFKKIRKDLKSMLRL